MKVEELMVRLGQIGEVDLTLLEPMNKETLCSVPVEHWLKVATFMVEEADVSHLSAITVQFRENEQQQLDVMYHFWCGQGITFLVKLPAEKPEIPSIVGIIPGADFYEREAAEMFGVKFTGRESTSHLLLPDDWDNIPPFKGGADRD